jgi:hypothetical protein
MDLFKRIILKAKSEKLILLLVLGYFIFCAIYITYPLIFNLSNLIFDKVDDAYITWIINWDIYSFTHNIFNIFNGNIFYPYNNTIAYSDTYFTAALIAFIPTIVIGNPAVAYNFNLIFSFISLGFSVYLLAFYIAKNHLSAIVAGTLVAFSSYTTAKVMHIQLLGIFWVPLSIICFLQFLNTKNYKYLYLTAILFLLQMYNSFLPGYFILFSCIFLFTYFIFKKIIRLRELKFKKILTTGIIVFLLVLPVIIPYYSVSRQFNYVRDIRDSIQFANRPEYTLYPGFTTKLNTVLTEIFYKYDKGPFTYDGFIGLAFFVLSFLAISYRIKNRHKKWLLFDIFLLLGVFAWILSLGPAFQWYGHVIKHPFLIPLPYALFYYVLPGFNGLRNSARWEMLFLLMFSIDIAIFLSIYLKNRALWIKFLLVIIICFEVLWEFRFPYQFQSIPPIDNFPKIYYFTKQLPANSVIAEFPIYNWNTFTKYNNDNLREYYSILGFTKTFNGAAGFDPPPWQAKVEYLIKSFPSVDSIKLLKDSGVNYVVLHVDEYNKLNATDKVFNGRVAPKGNEVLQYFKNNNYKFIYYVDNDYVYKIK